MNEAALYQAFQPFGPIASLRVCRDAVTRKSLGYAYVNYSTLADGERWFSARRRASRVAQVDWRCTRATERAPPSAHSSRRNPAATAAMQALNYSPLRGRPMRVMWVQRDPSARRAAVGNVFIKNLGPSVDTRNLAETFATFGNIVSCRVVVDDAGVSRGYGFVQFDNDASAKKAIEEVNGLELDGRPVFVGPFQKRTDRKKECVGLRGGRRRGTAARDGYAWGCG